jgi:anti-sigma regulatory factor (Ser/Thr protein kinase)
VISQRTFDDAPASVTQARRFVVGVLGDIEPDVADRVVVMVSELATNSVRHAHSPFTVTVERTPRDIRISVFDVGPERPAMRSPRPGEPTGRGLRIVQALADNWGVTTHDGAGKAVWFSLRALA